MAGKVSCTKLIYVQFRGSAQLICFTLLLIGRCWKKQLAIAKDARRVDVLCYRILLSYRLLDGTAKFKDLQEIVAEAKIKLEAEVGPMNGDSVKMARGIVSRLTIAADVQKLCSHAIDKANELLANVSIVSPNYKGQNHKTFIIVFQFLGRYIIMELLNLFWHNLGSGFTSRCMQVPV